LNVFWRNAPNYIFPASIKVVSEQVFDVLGDVSDGLAEDMVAVGVGLGVGLNLIDSKVLQIGIELGDVLVGNYVYSRTVFKPVVGSEAKGCKWDWLAVCLHGFGKYCYNYGWQLMQAITRTSDYI
jgi:hypothetical protein